MELPVISGFKLLCRCYAKKSEPLIPFNRIEKGQPWHKQNEYISILAPILRKIIISQKFDTNTLEICKKYYCIIKYFNFVF